ncbi:UvrD-helicase domain-containing protein [Streptomyces sp. NBC_01565]|uniref:UvrD-helicase domain-containing protein n=1 Tax=unclassified Streptomyces TaxID=2593676 RepID=UPI0022584A9D|nr:UvrD-helicase domain-containing protein [Streptomyces sp. NBC_01565]MCX4545845.1 UvrD-helicase domain-containing protein [Streptomyces sp. NBC_01565]
MAMEPTEEQRAARELFVAGGDLALVAGAGTGKTSTLTLMGAATRRRGLYVAFNRSIADDARSRFGWNVECRTSHSLAFKAVGRTYGPRLEASARIPAKQTARLLGITADLAVNATKVKVNHQARLVMGMLRRFSYSTDRQVMARHMERLNGLDLQGQDHVARTLLPYAEKAWEDILRLDGKLRFEHDFYLKMWALGGPVLPADFVLLDEAQDTNPVLEEVFLAQRAQRVCVGDPAQQIYAWRSAKDVMTGFPAEHLHLTQSFRFGPRIAGEANRWLRHAESDMRLTGSGPAGSRIGPADTPDAVLCRGNADAMQEVLAYLERGVPVALAGGGGALERIATAAQELKAGRRTSHPELFLFGSWGEVQEYVEQDQAAQDLKAIVQLVDSHGPEVVLKAVERLSPEESARVTVSTVHKAKGREWATVRIGDGFAAPPVTEEGRQLPIRADEARLIYVAVTRARHHLDVRGIGWADDYERAVAHEARSGTVAGVPLIDLSLTGQLRYPNSPVSRFMARHLPNDTALVQDYQRRIAGLPYPVQPLDVQYPDWSALGHAVDYRLRLSLGRPLGDAVALGIETVGSGHPLPGAPPAATRAALHRAGRDLLSAVEDHLARRSPLGEEDLSRLCFVAAHFEDVYRGGRVRRFSPLAGAGAATGLGRLCAGVPEYVVEDLARQIGLAEGPFRAFRALPEQARVCGPTFAGSTDIGGADADFILGGLLLDCKATTRPQHLGRAEIHQLAGYLLLDYDDRYGIDRVGLYLSRQGHLIPWPVTEFLARLGATGPLPELRARLRAHLRSSGMEQSAMRGAPVGPRVDA